MMPWLPDWRWLLDREDTPWYPTMRLFRQARPGDWRGVIARVAGELTEAIDNLTYQLKENITARCAGMRIARSKTWVSITPRRRKSRAGGTSATIPRFPDPGGATRSVAGATLSVHRRHGPFPSARS